MDRVVIYFQFLFIFLFASTVPIVASASQDDDFKTMILEGSNVPEALGYQVDTLSLAAIHNGIFEPIPFQIDEYNVGGAVYFENWEVPIDGTQGVLDGADKLLFLHKDAGEQLGNQKSDGKIIAEIQIGRQATGFKYVYLLAGSRLRSDEQYVRYSAELARVETDYYDLTYDSANHLIWRNFFLHSFGEKEPFDTMKIRISAAGLLMPFATIELDNEQIIAEPGGVRVGPIRTTTQLKVTMWMFEIPLLTASLQLHHYPKSLIYDMRLNIPEIRRSLILNPTAAVSLDGNELMGTRLLTAASSEYIDGAIVDGVMGREEAEIIKRGINSKDNWMYTSTNNNLDLMAYFDFVGETEVEPLSIVLVDDANIVDQPERFTGQLANFGIQINDMPLSGVMGFVVSLYFDEGFEGDPRSFSSTIRTIPDMQVRAFGS